MRERTRREMIVEWVESLPPFSRFLVLMGATVIASLIVVALVSVVLGWTSRLEISNTLFYAAGVLFLLAFLVYFASRAGPLPDEEEPAAKEPRAQVEDQEKDRERRRPDPLEKMMRRRRRGVPFYTTVLVAGGIVLFLLSILVWYILPGA